MIDIGRKTYHFMYSLAITNHHNKQYKDGMEYRLHIDEVIKETANILNKSYSNSIPKDSTMYWYVLAIAAGHDLVEDTKVSLQLFIDMRISEVVICGIGAISRQSGESLTAYIDRIRVSSCYALIVKKADSTCNLRHSIICQDTRRIRKYLSTLSMLHEDL